MATQNSIREVKRHQISRWQADAEDEREEKSEPRTMVIHHFDAGVARAACQGLRLGIVTQWDAEWG